MKERTNNKKPMKQKKPSLQEVLNTMDKNFDKKLKVLIDTPPIREKDIKKKAKK
jgi:hypothetical protein